MPKRSSFPIIVKRGAVKVRIYRAKNRDGWLSQVTDYVSGRRKLRSFADLRAARTEAQRLATHLANGELDALKLTAGDRAAYVRARQHLEPSGAALELATSVYARAV